MPQDVSRSENLLGSFQRPLEKATLLAVVFTFGYLLAASTGNIYADTFAANPLTWQVAQIPSSSEPQTTSQPEAVRNLPQKLLSTDPDKKTHASRSLSAMPPEVNIPALVQALQDKDENVRLAAAVGLEKFGLEGIDKFDRLNPGVLHVSAKKIWELVHDLLRRKSSPGSTPPQPQTAPTGR